MPIKYREYVSKLRAESSILYRQQRISPKVIQINDKGAAIKLVDAPMADPTVQYALRDAEYANLREARLHMEKGIDSSFAQSHSEQPCHESISQVGPTGGPTSSVDPTYQVSSTGGPTSSVEPTYNTSD